MEIWIKMYFLQDKNYSGQGKEGGKQQRYTLFPHQPSLNLLTNVAMSIYPLPLERSPFFMPNWAYFLLIVKSEKTLDLD